MLEQWFSHHDLIKLNRGEASTFKRGNSQSHIDVAIATSRLAADLVDWRVLEDESFSDHNFILMDFEGRIKEVINKEHCGWKTKEQDWPRFVGQVRALIEVNRSMEPSAEDLQRIVIEACKRSFKGKSRYIGGMMRWQAQGRNVLEQEEHTQDAKKKGSQRYRNRAL